MSFEGASAASSGGAAGAGSASTGGAAGYGSASSGAMGGSTYSMSGYNTANSTVGGYSQYASGLSAANTSGGTSGGALNNSGMMAGLYATGQFLVFGDQQVQDMYQKAHGLQQQARYIDSQYKRDDAKLLGQINATLSRNRAISAVNGASGTAQGEAILTGAAEQGARARTRLYVDAENRKEELRAAADNMRTAATNQLIGDYIASAVTIIMAAAA